MKQKMLQILVSIFGNSKKLELFIRISSKIIKKNVGRQKSGKKRCSIENAVAGILYYIKSGCQWRMLPSIFGNWRTVYGWYSRIHQLKIFEKLWKLILNFAVSAKKINLNRLLIDGSLLLTTSNISLKAKNPRHKNKNCINRLVVTNGKGFPLTLLFAKGTANDTTFLPHLINQTLQSFQMPKRFSVHADKGFDSFSNRICIARNGARVMIPLRKHGYTVTVPALKDKTRSAVERSFAWQNSFRQLKTISTKLISNLYQNHFIAFSIIGSRFLNFKNMKCLIKSI